MGVKKMNRNKKSPNGKAYLAEGRALKNKKTKIARHQESHPNDKQTVGTVPDYTTTKSEGYLFGAIPKRLSNAGGRNVNRAASTNTKNK